MLPIIAAAAVAAAQPALTAAPALDCSAVELNPNRTTLLNLRLKGERSDATITPPSDGKQGYVRLVVEYTPCFANYQRFDERNYKIEERDWVKRFFAHKVVSKLLKVTATVKPT